MNSWFLLLIIFSLSDEINNKKKLVSIKRINALQLYKLVVQYDYIVWYHDEDVS